MLVLTRKNNETLVIGKDIFVTVLDIQGDRVKLGIDAPRDISIHRKEIFDAIAEENKLATTVRPEQLSQLAKFMGD
ncbi:MAG: carbon storage regulator CsrA [Clostridia bacterium]|nr:carbon storage regulator CsrA [Clostridia bacterium]